MRFYLTYKDHGFYDPVVDDTEVIYIPIDPEELELVNIQTNIRESQQKLEIIDFNRIGEPSTLVQPIQEFLTDPDIEELPFLINVDEIPPGSKFRLPVSDSYDPEGNRVKLDKSKGKAVVTFNVTKIVDETSEERIRLQQQAQNAVSEYISESKINQHQDFKENLIETEKETDVNIIRDKALEVVNECIDRGISNANEINENIKTEIKTSEDLPELITTELSKKFDQKLENVNILKESIKNIECEVNVSEEIKKFEKVDTQTTESNIVERKLVAKQDIDETIQSGTVRRTSEIFNKENIEISKPYRIETNKDYDPIHTKKDENSNNDSSAKQRAFSIGLQTIPRIRENINNQIDCRLNLLTTFFLQLTNIMVTLSRFIAAEKKTYLAQDSCTPRPEQRGFEQKKEKIKVDKSNEETFERFEQHEEGPGLSKYKYEHVSHDSEGEIIRKGKLSGAKIAQIEGRKTTELTDKMDIVISEFHKKTGSEEQSYDQFYGSHSGSRSKMKSEKNIFYEESQKQSHTDQRKTYEDFSEIKTQSLDIREMKSENHSFESKTIKTEEKPYAYKTTSTDGQNLTYVAIVEAHVYTNKEAIFEEQMKREMEMKSKNSEQIKIETNQDIGMLSLADTITIPQTEVISVNEIKDEVNKIERGVSTIEESTIKIAAKKISEVLEPLIELTSGRSYSVKQTDTVEEQDITGLSRKIYPSLEKPIKGVVEITEITAEEKESQDLDVLKLIVAKPKSLIEDAKPIAETIEISIKEDELAVFDESEPHLQKTRQLVESIVKSVAETTEVVTGSLAEESKSGFVEKKTKEKYPLTSMEDPHLKIAQVFTILPNEPKDEHFEVTKIKECKSSIDIVEIKAAETIIIYPEEPKCEQLEVLKIEEKLPETIFEGPSLKVAEILSVLPEEPKDEFYVPELKNQQAGLTIIEFKAVESTIVEAEESKQQELKIEQPEEKKSKTIIEPSSLSVALETKEIVKSDEVSRSIFPTSPLSPTTPIVEEYMFSLEAEIEHPYVVEEAVSEEASIKIEKQKKNIQSADTRFTLAIEKIIEANSGTIEEMEEIENIHLSKELHESMYEGYEAKKSNMSANIEVKTLDANQSMSTDAQRLDAHHNLTVKSQTMMQDAVNIASLETNQNIKKSRKVLSNESQYSAGLEIQSSGKSIQSRSSGASIKAESTQHAEASNKLLSISESKSMESTVMEGNIGLETHKHLRKVSAAASKSIESKSVGTMESVSQLSTQIIKGESNASLLNEKLTLRTDIKSTISNDCQTSSPLPEPPTPVTDEYVFRLQAELPKESTFIPRDCSISPESAHEDVVVKGLLTNYKTNIEDRILFSPPLPTPPTSPEKAKPVYTKPGLKGGSERQELTKEEIYDSTLVSAIDRTLKQIEEYKASVGLTTEEMSYHQEDVDKEFTPIQIVEEWLDNESNQDKPRNSKDEEVDAIKITIVAEDNNAGETAVTVTTERHVDDDGDDLEIQEIARNFDEISLEIENGRALNEQRSNENKVDDFKRVQINPDSEVHEDDYEWVAVHPSSLNRNGAGHDNESVTTTQVESEVLITDVNAQEVQTTDKSQELVMRHDQEIRGDEAIIPPVDSLKNSEVIKLLNEERTGVEERKWTTFLQKKYSPTPKTEVVYYGDFDIKTQIIPDAYKVKIVRQPKPKIAPDWKDETLKKESSPVIEISAPEVTVVTEIEENDIIEEDINICEEEDNKIEQEENIEEGIDTEIIEEVIDKETAELDLEEMAQRNLAEELIKNVENMIDVNAPTDQQIEQMRDQLAALAQLPSVIQRTVELVNKRINLISQKEQQKKDEEEEHRRQEEEHRRQEEEYRRQEEEKHAELERAKHSLELRVQKTEEELAFLLKEQGKRRIIAEEKQKKEKVELMKIDQKSRQVTQRSSPRVGKPMSLFGPLQERPVVLPGGKKWRTPEDVYDDEFITESLVGQAEVIKGTAIGVNFMKFDKPPPALDHLKHSEVFKAIHNIEEPVKKVELLGPVLSDADYREKARSMSPCVEKVAEFSGTKQVQREVDDLS